MAAISIDVAQSARRPDEWRMVVNGRTADFIVHGESRAIAMAEALRCLAENETWLIGLSA